MRSHVLGSIKRPLTASNQPKHRKTLKNGNKTQVGRKSYLWSCQKLANPGSTRSLLRVEHFCLQLRRKPTVRSWSNSREKSETLSLESPFSSSAQLLDMPTLIHVFFCSFNLGRRPLLVILSFSDLNRFQKLQFFPSFPVLTFGTISAVQFNHFSTHATYET